ncbi:hypothetical protein NEFER03_1279 [Nematocida sp. LUAm3]|nr:hypothetical protein NEFER03_1279 [Nematocida sp. LUAm3]KAI5174099.1 hypothetical protein NEFER02_0566 [Nematocida sp. LUAm2]KAI5177158.1 hypothetical protein NEFER01_0433 [Nematocida sp. LUAm1]
MEKSLMTLLCETRRFIRQEGYFYYLRKDSPQAIRKYTAEIIKHIKHLSYLERKLIKRIDILKNRFPDIAHLSSSTNPVILQELIFIKLSILVDRSIDILAIIRKTKEEIKEHKDLVEMSFNWITQKTTKDFEEPFRKAFLSSCSIDHLSRMQHFLNQRMQYHYAQYNFTLLELEKIIEENNVSVEDRKLIHSIVFPKSSTDDFPHTSSILRAIFGTRVHAAGSFYTEILQKTSHKEIYLPPTPNRMDIFLCSIHFLRNHLLTSSMFFSGALTIIIFIYQNAPHKYLSNSWVVSILLGCVAGALFSWFTFCIFGFFFFWIMGYSTIHSLQSTPALHNITNRDISVFSLGLLNMFFTTAFSLLSFFVVSFSLSFLSPGIRTCISYFSILSSAFYCSYIGVLASSFMISKSTSGPSIPRILLVFSFLLCCICLISGSIFLYTFIRFLLIPKI